MTVISLNAGNLWTEEYLNKVIELNNEYGDSVRVTSLFGSISGLTPTARAADRLPYLEWRAIDRFVDNATKNGIAVRYTLNQSCIGALQDFQNDWEKKLKDDIKELHLVGVHEWTVTSPLLVELLRELFPSDFIEVSTIYEVAHPQEAQHLMSLGAEAVNLSTSINRKPSSIKHVMDTGIGVSILANEACLFRCPWRRECYNLSSHNSERSEELFGNYPFADCNNYRMNNPVEWIKARMVLPSWMRTYQQEFGINNFKVAFRTHPYETAIPILEYYMKQEDPLNLLNLWPTVAHLGHTKEPESMHFISTKLHTPSLLSMFLELGEMCDSKLCGETCKVCHEITEQALVVKAQ